MREMTKRNLTLESFIQNVIDELNRKSAKTSSVEDVVLHRNDEQIIETLYKEGETVGQVADAFVSNYYTNDWVYKGNQYNKLMEPFLTQEMYKTEYNDWLLTYYRFNIVLISLNFSASYTLLSMNEACRSMSKL